MFCGRWRIRAAAFHSKDFPCAPSHRYARPQEKKRFSIRPFFAETVDNGPTMKAIPKWRDRIAEY